MDPQSNIWGCHFHIDTNDNNIPSRQLIQKMNDYLKGVGADITTCGVFTPGFGPHTQFDHEIRFEKYYPQKVLFTTPLKLFESMGYGIMWGVLNNNGFVFSLHPLTQIGSDNDNVIEARDHDKRGVWLTNGLHPKWNVNFF